MAPIVFDEVDVERFLSYVEVLDSGCWLWTGARSRGKGNKKWYGSFAVKGRTVRAHTFALAVSGVECPDGYHRDHICNFSLCVNPEHFECVTREENQRRKTARTRIKPVFKTKIGVISGGTV